MDMKRCYKFLNWLAEAVFEKDFEENPSAYIEVICRYLVKLGYLKLEDDTYKPIE